MIVTEMSEGKKIAYEANGTVLTLGDGRIALDLQKYQKDYPVTLDFVTDGEGNVLVNAMDTLRAYVAEVRLPAYETEEVEVEEESEADTTVQILDAAEEAGIAEDEDKPAEKKEKTEIRRKPLDMDKVELDLFSIDGIYINQQDGDY